MSASAAVLTSEEYEERKRFLEELKTLVKNEQEEIYRILKNSRAECSENSNGVFFDVCKLPAETFDAMKKIMAFCRKNREEFATREEESRRAQEALAWGRD
jgi:hypothetical protein